jgi:NADPH:quinone reductase-like Zn-dependent oxidoreductase
VEAATMPIAFLTVRYALSEVGRLQAGERVLIHSAAGGVGLAAVQWARALGAPVVWHRGKRAQAALLEALVVNVIGSSRDLPADATVEVDVVLNALSGDAIDWSLRRLAPGGRFLELGKRGIWTAEQVAAVRPDVAYTVVDLLEKIGRERRRWALGCRN